MFATSPGRSTWQSWPVLSSATSQPEARAFAANGAERPRRIFFRNAGNEGGRNAGLPIGRKPKGLFKAMKTKIAQSCAHELTRLARLKSPEVKLSLSAW